MRARSWKMVTFGAQRPIARRAPSAARREPSFQEVLMRQLATTMPREWSFSKAGAGLLLLSMSVACGTSDGASPDGGNPADARASSDARSRIDDGATTDGTSAHDDQSASDDGEATDGGDAAEGGEEADSNDDATDGGDESGADAAGDSDAAEGGKEASTGDAADDRDATDGGKDAEPIDGASSTPPVNLGTAGNYVILAKSAISNVPTSAVTGNIGISPAAATYITGFSPLTMDSTNEFSISSQVVGKVYA